MSAAVQVSLAEYLSTSYEPDCEYVDGVLEERNLGTRRHSQTQGLLYAWLLSKAREHRHDIRLEQRVQISKSRFRIPDICLVPKTDLDDIVEHPPALWIEVLSPEDRWSRIRRRLADILSSGVPSVWIVDPCKREAWMATPELGTVKVEDGMLRCESLGLEVELKEILPEN